MLYYVMVLKGSLEGAMTMYKGSIIRVTCERVWGKRVQPTLRMVVRALRMDIELRDFGFRLRGFTTLVLRVLPKPPNSR